MTFLYPCRQARENDVQECQWTVRTLYIFILLILASSHMCAGQARTYSRWSLSHGPDLRGMTRSFAEQAAATMMDYWPSANIRRAHKDGAAAPFYAEIIVLRTKKIGYLNTNFIKPFT